MWQRIPKHIQSEAIVLSLVGKKNVYVLGTAHVSKESSQNASNIVEIVKPKVVFLELCDNRRRILETQDREQFKRESITFKTAINGLKSGELNMFAIIYSHILSKIGSELEVLPGEEFRAAHQAGQIIGATTVLGDRPVDITLKRVWQGLTLMQKCRLLYTLLFTGKVAPDSDEFKAIMEDMKQRGDSMTDALLEMGEDFPWLVECLVNERDLYMTYHLRKVTTPDLLSRAT
jgi:pheromone shutdown protein TraB